MYDLLKGRKVDLKGSTGPLKTCPSCGSVVGILTGPSKSNIHASGVRCDGCELHLGWLGRTAADHLVRQAEAAHGSAA